MEKFSVILAFLSVYLVVNFFWQVKGATTNNVTDEVITIGDGPARTLTFWGYPKRVSVHDQMLLNRHGRKGGGGAKRKSHGKAHKQVKNTTVVPVPGLPGGQDGGVVVAKDGTGRVTNISQAAEMANGDRNVNMRFHIHVKAGIYDEIVEIKRPHVLLTGDGIDRTIIRGQKRAIEGKVTTSDSATFVVSGAGFMARDITFENYAGRDANQAVALRADKDSFFYKCRFKGYQDTLYLKYGRQFYRDCEISGTTDFIFGDATAVLQNCHIIVRKPPNGHSNMITAQGRDNPTSTTGFVIQNSKITAEPGLRQARGSIKTYLGRPWRPFSRTVFMNTDLGDFIDPAGWRAWNKQNGYLPDTTYYAEFSNTGASADTRGRTRWKGYHQLSAQEAEQFTVKRFLSLTIPHEIPVS